jgi:predicted RecA/RadA family phage recombinase
VNNFEQRGEVQTFTAPTGGVVSGTPVQIGRVLAIPCESADAGEAFAGAIVGVFTLPKAAGQVWNEGDLLYFDSVAGNVTTTSTNNLRIGWAAHGGAASAAVLGKVYLQGTAAPAGA